MQIPQRISADNLCMRPKKPMLFLPLLITAAGLLSGFPALPADVGFMGIRIGMTREEVLSFADERKIIEVPKNRDVEFFPVEERKILTLSIRPEIPQMYLQFHGEKLYAVTVTFDEKYIDFYVLASELEKKYGPYTSLTPVWRRWEIDGVEVKLEKPAVVKYIAIKEFLEVTDFKKPEGYQGSERRKLLLDGL
jgi:hypothetical protein